MEIVKTEEMRRMDEEAIATYHIPGILLMEHAAMAVLEYMRESVRKQDAIVLLCGPGNNGGDGFALARLLVEDGYERVRIHCSVAIERMSEDEAVYANIAMAYGLDIVTSQNMADIKELLQGADVVVDALFGTGLSRNITGFYAELISYLNQLDTHVISIDIASGVHGDSGRIMNCAVQSDVTITFACLKQGQLLYPGSACCGKILVKPITIPQKAKAKRSYPIDLLDKTLVSSFLPKRSAHSHKGSYGKVLMIGGSHKMHGAITLAAKAALHSGLGTLTLCVPESIRTILSMKMEGCMLLPTPQSNGSFAMEAVDILRENLAHYDVVSIGNGMGRGKVSEALVRCVLESDRPCILDADALYEAGKMRELLAREAVTIVTPHPKEMSYLCGLCVEDIMKDPLQCAKTFVEAYPHVVLVFKDMHTIVCDSKQMYMNTAGNHALAKGGSGDVLCGILTGLFAQGKQPLPACAAAVYVHACAADLLMETKDAYSIQPGDVADVLSDVYRMLKSAV